MMTDDVDDETDLMELPPEWRLKPENPPYSEPILERQNLVGGTIVLVDEDGDEVLRGQLVADDLVDDLEKPGGRDDDRYRGR